MIRNPNIRPTWCFPVILMTACLAGCVPVPSPPQTAALPGKACRQVDNWPDVHGWGLLLKAWVESHEYYPEEAVLNEEEGCPVIRITVLKDGTVKDVSLVKTSGSAVLDLGSMSLFRNRTLPPLPPEVSAQSLTFTFTVNYIFQK